MFSNGESDQLFATTTPSSSRLTDNDAQFISFFFSFVMFCMLKHGEENDFNSRAIPEGGVGGIVFRD